MQIRADRRSADTHVDPECELEAIEAAGEFRGAALRMARALARVEGGGVHLLRGYANVRDYAVARLCLSGDMAMALVAVGRRLDAPAAPHGEDDADADDVERTSAAPENGPIGTPTDGASFDACYPETDDGEPGPARAPTFEDRLRDGRLSMANAGAFDRLVRTFGELSAPEHAHWTALAESTSEWKFGQLVRKAIEEFRQGAPTVSLRLQITETARRDFRRAGVLASRRAGVNLTEGQVFAAMARHFVREHDKLVVGEKPRRTPHTRLLPGRRYTPAAVERAVLRRGEDRCEVGDCTNDTFLQLMHVRTPHALGGSREVEDLAAGCSRHHLLHDAGVIRFVGFDASNRPMFRTRGGRLLRRSPAPVPAMGAAAPRQPILAAADP